MKKLLGLFFLLATCVSSLAGAIDYRALLTNDFTTNIPGPFYVGLNTNRGATMSNYFYQSITGPVSSNYIYSVLTNNAANTNGGTVSSVGLTMDGQVFSNTVPGSPVISSGTLVPGLLTHPANEAFIGPISGADTTPTFRSLAAQDLPIVAGTNVIIWTNANVLNIASSGGGSVNVITNFATTNSNVGLTNAIASIITNEVTTAGFTNEILSISSNSAANVFSNTVPNFIHGTTNYIAKFTPNTNEVGNSIVFEANTNQWEWRSRPTGTAWTNSVTNRIFGQYTSEANYAALDIISSYGTTTPPASSSEFNLIQGKQGASSTSLTFPLRLMNAWQINSAVNTPGGFTAGYLTPLVDNTYNIGSTSSQVHDIDLGGQILWNSAPTSPALAKIGGFGVDLTTTGVDIWEVSFGVFASFDNLAQGGRSLDLGQNVLSFSGVNPKTASTPRGYLTFGNADQVVQIGTNCAVASATAVTLQSSRGTGTDSGSANLQITPGSPTGSGSAGHLIVLSPTNSPTSGTAATGKQTREFISSHAVDVTSGVATKLFTVALISTNHVGMLLEVTTECEDAAGEVQCVQDTVAIAIVNKAGTVSTSVSASVPTATVVTTGTLTTAITAVNSSGNCDVKMTATTSLTPTVLRSRWKLSQSGNGNMTISPN